MGHIEDTHDLTERFAATEMALQHSSSRSVRIQDVCDYLQKIASALDNHAGIAREAQDFMEKAYQDFVLAGQLTPDREMQALLDALKVKAKG